MGTILKSILPTSLRGLRLNSLTIGKAIPIYNFLFEAQDGKLSHIILSKLALKAQNFFLNSRRLFFFFLGTILQMTQNLRDTACFMISCEAIKNVNIPKWAWPSLTTITAR